MITVLAALAAQAAAVPNLDVAVPNAIAGLHEQYVRCQDDQFDVAKVTGKKAFQVEVERAIRACAERRTELIEQSEAALAADPDYRDPAVRRRAVLEAFDGFDRVRRFMAEL